MSVSLDSSEEPSLGHRRLRFSFQINDFKDQDRKNRPHCLAPVNGGGGDLENAAVVVKRLFALAFFPNSLVTARVGRRGFSWERPYCQPSDLNQSRLSTAIGA